MVFSDGRFHWDVQFFCPMQDWELESIAFFMDIIYSTFVQGNGLDQICWKPTKTRGFEVRGYYHSLSLANAISFPSKMVWQEKFPSQVTFFPWSAALGKIFFFYK